MGPREHYEEVAERIIRSEGLAFALASSVGRDTDLREARQLLKQAIAMALGAAFERGAEMQRKAIRSNDEIDELERRLS